ncbi:hypothetical protein CHUAL_001474 [Chamberlinius hualienensis]
MEQMSIVVSDTLLKKWTDLLQNVVNREVLIDVIDGFVSAVEFRLKITCETPTKYKITNNHVSDDVFELCFRHFPTAMKNFLKLNENSFQSLFKCKKWSKVSSVADKFLKYLHLILMDERQQIVPIQVLLEHILHLAFAILQFNHHTKQYTKKLVSLWSTTSSEDIRLRSYNCLLHLGRQMDDQLLQIVLRSMYEAFKKISSSNADIRTVKLMQMCFLEILNLNEVLAYNFGCKCLNQLRRSKSVDQVYDWSYIHSLGLWTRILTKLNDKQLRGLVYPLVELIMTTIRLNQKAEDGPLRLKCVNYLIKISTRCGCFIPILFSINTFLDAAYFNKEKMKQPADISSILRLSETQQIEPAFKEAIWNRASLLLLKYLSSVSYSVGFPELVVSTVIKLRCSVKESNSRQLKQLLEKIEENCKFIVEPRKLLHCKIADMDAIAAFETQLKFKHSPLVKYYNHLNPDKKFKLQERQAMEMVKIFNESGSANNKSNDNEDDDFDVDMKDEFSDLDSSENEKSDEIEGSDETDEMEESDEN